MMNAWACPTDTHEPSGAALDHTRFRIVPNSLLAHKWSRGRSATDVVVLLHIDRFWRTRDQDPYPSTARIVEQMGLRIRSVERCLDRHEAKGGDPQTANSRVAISDRFIPTAPTRIFSPSTNPSSRSIVEHGRNAVGQDGFIEDSLAGRTDSGQMAARRSAGGRPNLVAASHWS